MTAPQFQFVAPSGGGGYFTPKDHLGHALLIKAVREIDKHFDQLKNNRQGGEVDRVRFDYVDLNDPAGPGAELVTDALNTHIGIVSRLKRYVGTGQMMLARVGQVPPSQPGMSPAFILEDATQDPAVVAAASAWLIAEQQRSFVAPAAPPAVQQVAYPAPTMAPAQPAYTPPPVAQPADPWTVAPPADMTPAAQLAAYGQPPAPQQVAQQAIRQAVAPQPPAGQPAYNPYGSAHTAAMQQAAPPAVQPVQAQPIAPGQLPTVPGMTPEQVAQLVANGADVAGIAALANQLGAAAPAAGQ